MFKLKVIKKDRAMTTMEKLKILTDAAKYDVACTSSGVDRSGKKGGLGSTQFSGICHSFAADGRCISLLKVLYTNSCICDCKYCVNRRSNDVRRASFTPRELAELTIGFYKRNYIEGLFLSSGIIKNPDYTCEQMLKVLELLREEYHFRGYIHVKAIPGADDQLLKRLGMLADRMSVNIELPSEESLNKLCPDKNRKAIFHPMGLISSGIQVHTKELAQYRYAPKFVPAGQSTQMIIGATKDTDYQILNLAESLYHKYQLKRVFFSAYVPVAENALLPPLQTKPPLLREHRLYQADWLLRYYGFEARELLDQEHPQFNAVIDPKCNWALQHMNFFPVEVNCADYHTLLRVPGIGPKSAKAILQARRASMLDFTGLKKLGVVLKRAQYFLTCSGRIIDGLRVTPDIVLRNLISQQGIELLKTEEPPEQLSFFSPTESFEQIKQLMPIRIRG
jgi:putative DNA modification/repair radical SAM protein